MLALAPSAKVALLSSSRKVERLTEGFVDVDAALNTLRQLPREHHNGSNVDLALHEALTLLARQDGTRRVLLITDGIYRSSMALSHVGVLAQQARAQVDVAGDYSDALKRLVQHTGRSRTALGDMSELLLPSRVESGALWPVPQDCAGALVLDNLRAGEALKAQEQPDNRLLEIGNHPASAGLLEYRFPGKRERRWVQVDPQLSRFETAWLEDVRLGQQAWFLALPGQLPALTDPLPTLESRGLVGIDDCGHYGYGGEGISLSGCFLLPPEGLDHMNRSWKNVLEQCGANATHDIRIEVSGKEILDVDESNLTRLQPDMRRCLVDGAWEIHLTEAAPNHCFYGWVKLSG